MPLTNNQKRSIASEALDALYRRGGSQSVTKPEFSAALDGLATLIDNATISKLNADTINLEIGNGGLKATLTWDDPVAALVAIIGATPQQILAALGAAFTGGTDIATQKHVVALTTKLILEG